MSKPNIRVSSDFTLSAIKLLGQLIREQRIKRRVSTTELAIRSGVSRSFLRLPLLLEFLYLTLMKDRLLKRYISSMKN